MIDPILICMYCGDLMDYPSEEMIERFGIPPCCDNDMLCIEKNNLHALLKGIEALKANIENEIIKDQL